MIYHLIYNRYSFNTLLYFACAQHIWCTVKSSRLKKCEYAILEETTVGKLVGDLFLDSSLAFDESLKHNSLLTWTLYDDDSSQALTSKLFRLDPKKGQLFVAKRIDREVLCGDDTNCQLEFSVLVLPEQMWINVLIVIQDVNDHSPQFVDKYQQIHLSEGAQPGYRLPLNAATDPDSHPNAIETYSLHRGSFDPFSVIYELPNTVYLVVSGKLDHETQSYYNVTLVACDGGSPPLCGQQMLLIQLIDQNDNKPIFTAETYTFEVKEDIPLDSLLGRVKAVDADSEENGAVSYHFVQSHDPTPKQYIKLISHHGVLYLQKLLDAKVFSKLEFQMEARDGGKSVTNSAQCKVILTVQDVNDHHPTILMKPIQDGLWNQNVSMNSQSTWVSVPENTPPDTSIALMWVSDGDLGDNGRVICKWLPTSNRKEDKEEMLFQVKLTNQVNDIEIYTIFTKQIFDRELMEQVSLIIECRDHGVPQPLSTTTTLTVNIQDSNEFAPQFDRSKYHISIAENAPPGTLLIHLNATDLDATDHVFYQLQLSSDSIGLFHVEEQTGRLLTKGNLDRETKVTYSFTVFAFDHIPVEEMRIRNGSMHSIMGHTTAATVIIEIMDVNDNTPRLLNKDLKLEVIENQSYSTNVAQPIGKLETEDGDVGENGQVSFSLEHVIAYSSLSSHPMTNDLFHVDERMGWIYASGVFDREEYHSYDLQIVLYDHGQPSLNTTSIITIIVADVNEHKPKFLSPDLSRAHSNVMNISIPLPPNVVLMRLVAHDLDDGENANISYHMISPVGDKAKLFHLHPITGALSTQLPLLDDMAFNVTFLFEARDAGRPMFLSTNLSFTINFQILSFYLGMPAGMGSSMGNIPMFSTNRYQIWLFILVLVMILATFSMLLLCVILVQKEFQRRRMNRQEITWRNQMYHSPAYTTQTVKMTLTSVDNCGQLHSRVSDKLVAPSEIPVSLSDATVKNTFFTDSLTSEKHVNYTSAHHFSNKPDLLLLHHHHQPIDQSTFMESPKLSPASPNSGHSSSQPQRFQVTNMETRPCKNESFSICTSLHIKNTSVNGPYIDVCSLGLVDEWNSSTECDTRLHANAPEHVYLSPPAPQEREEGDNSTDSGHCISEGEAQTLLHGDAWSKLKTSQGSSSHNPNLNKYNDLPDATLTTALEPIHEGDANKKFPIVTLLNSTEKNTKMFTSLSQIESDPLLPGNFILPASTLSDYQRQNSRNIGTDFHKEILCIPNWRELSRETERQTDL